MIKFNKVYFLFTLLLLLTEVLIARCLHGGFICVYGGDFLVAIFLYCLAKSSFSTPVLPTAGCVLVFAYAVEISQYFHLITGLGLQNSRAAELILGTTFSMIDMLTYTLGILLVIMVEALTRKTWKTTL